MNSRLITIIALASACAGWSQSSAAPAQSRGEVVYNQGASTIGGEPFLVKGIFGVGAEELGPVASDGCNVVPNYGTNDWSDEEVADCLNQAHVYLIDPQ